VPLFGFLWKMMNALAAAFEAGLTGRKAHSCRMVFKMDAAVSVVVPCSVSRTPSSAMTTAPTRSDLANDCLAAGIGQQRIVRGRLYSGYRLINHGYYPPDRCVWWEAENLKTGEADFRATTRRQLKAEIDSANDKIQPQAGQK